MMRVRVRVGSSEVEAKTLEASGERLNLGRNPDCEIAIDPVAFPTVSGVHARIEPTSAGFVLVHLSRNNKTLLNDAPVEGSAPIRPGDKVRLGTPARRSSSSRSRRRRRSSTDSVRRPRPTPAISPCFGDQPKPNVSFSGPAG